MSDWFTTLEGVLDRVWESLALGVEDADHPARLPVFATVSPGGWPEARTVALRRADRGPAVVEVQTDIDSLKVESLRASPRAALHWWLAEDALQIRLRTGVAILTGEAVRAEWEAVPPASRYSYGETPPPGRPLQGALAYEKAPDFASFAVLRCSVLSIDAVHLGESHRRARFDAADGFAGQWLAP